MYIFYCGTERQVDTEQKTIHQMCVTARSK